MTPPRPGSRTIGRAAIVVSVGVLLSRVLGYVRTLIIGSLLGLGVDTDLYAAAFTIPDILFFLMAGGYLSITLVPLLAEPLKAGNERKAGQVFTTIFRVVVGATLTLTVALIIGAEPITARFFPRITGDAFGRLVGMVRIAFASQVFFIAGTMFMAAQYTRRRFLIPTLAPLVYNIGIIAGGLIGWVLGDASPEAFIWGGFAGAALGNLAIQMWGAHRAGIWFTKATPLWNSSVPEYFRLALPLMVGISAVALDEAWPKLFGQFLDEGAISQLFYARTLNMLPVGVIAQAAGVAAYPFLAGLAAEHKITELRRTVLRSVRASISVGAGVAALVVALAVPLVRIAFQYGRFDAADTEAVGALLPFFAVSIPFWAAHQIYTRAFYAQRRMWTPVLIGSTVTAAIVPTLLWAVDRFGSKGVAAVSTLGVITYTVAIAVAWHRRNGIGEGAKILTTATKVVLGASAAAAVASLVVALGARLDVARIPAAAVAALIGAVLYLLVGRLLGNEDLTAVWKKLTR